MLFRSLKSGQTWLGTRSSPWVFDGWLYFYGWEYQMCRCNLARMDDGIQVLTQALSGDALEFANSQHVLPHPVQRPLFEHSPPPGPCAPGDGCVYTTNIDLWVENRGPFGIKWLMLKGLGGTVHKVEADRTAKVTTPWSFSIDPRRPPTSPGDGYLYLVEKDGGMSILPIAFA